MIQSETQSAVDVRPERHRARASNNKQANTTGVCRDGYTCCRPLQRRCLFES